MEFPDGRIKEGFFENNVFKGPVETPKMQQLKAQEIMMNDMRTPTNIRVKSRGASFPRPNLDNTTRLPNKLETIEVRKMNANQSYDNGYDRKQQLITTSNKSETKV
jgi:hypothetical protein